VARVRTFEELRVAGRHRTKADALAEELAGELDLAVSVAASWAEACDGADVVCATTHALEPVVRREWLTPGAHVTSVGCNVAGGEVDDATVVDSLVVVESRAAALAPVPAGSNDLLQPIERGLIDADHVYAEVGELIDGQRPGRTSAEQITCTSRSASRCRTALPQRWSSVPPDTEAQGGKSSCSRSCRASPLRLFREPRAGESALPLGTSSGSTQACRPRCCSSLAKPERLGSSI
jgi:hypothetical protein